MIVHLESATAFWNFSIGAGLAGKPTRFLADFDPVASPAACVAGAPERTDAEVLDQFASTTLAFCDLVASLDADGLAALAEAPPGHLHDHGGDPSRPLGRARPRARRAGSAGHRRAPPRRRGAGGPDLCRRSRGRVRPSARGERPRRAPWPSRRPDPTQGVVAVSDHVTVRPVDGSAAHRRPRPARRSVRPAGGAQPARAPLDQPVPADVAWLVDGLATAFDQAR